MTSTPEFFREEYRKCGWIFDFFAHSFDFLNSRFIPPRDGALMAAWSLESDRVAQLKLTDFITEADGGIPNEVRDYIAIPGGNSMESEAFRLRLFCLLTAIDNAASDLNYLGAATRYTSTRWSNVATHLDKNGKQLQSAASGRVVLKPKYFTQPPWKTWLDKAIATNKWTHIPPRGEYLSTYFQNLLRISNRDDCGFEIYRLSDNQDFPHADWATLKIGIVPLIEDLKVGASDAQLLPGPLVLRKESENPSTFGIHLPQPETEECAELCDRAEAALRHLVKQGCQIILFPEMVVPEQVVKRLAKTLRKMEADRETRPALVLAGTFTRVMPVYSSDKPFNVAVALDHRGFEICRQRKTQPYDMKRHEQRKFGLEPILDSDSCRENIAFSDRNLYFVDSPASGIRMLILICEDLAQDPGLQAIREFHPTLVLAPVMAGPLIESSGFATSLNTTLQRVPSVFVVANSGAMARAAWKQPGNPPLGIVGLPLLSVPHDYRPLEMLSDVQAIPGSPSPQVLLFQFPS